jgi:hypothetical protein
MQGRFTRLQYWNAIGTYLERGQTEITVIYRFQIRYNGGCGGVGIHKPIEKTQLIKKSRRRKRSRIRKRGPLERIWNMVFVRRPFFVGLMKSIDSTRFSRGQTSYYLRL